MQWLGRAVPTDDDVGVTATEHAVGNATEHDGVVATEHGGVAATEHGLSTGTSANSYYRRPVEIMQKLLPTPLLQSMAVACERHTQRMWKGNAPKWRIDMQATCDAKVEHFEKLTVILARHGQQSTQEMMRAAVESKALPLFKAIQDITCQAANIPLTQATKWACDSWASRSTYMMVHCQSSSLQTLQIYTHR